MTMRMNLLHAVGLDAALASAMAAMTLGLVARSSVPRTLERALARSALKIASQQLIREPAPVVRLRASLRR